MVSTPPTNQNQNPFEQVSGKYTYLQLLKGKMLKRAPGQQL
jgi:hypothetical protein